MGRKVTKNEEQLTKDLDKVIKKIYQVLEGTPEEKSKVIQDIAEQALRFIIQKEKEKIVKNLDKKSSRLEKAALKHAEIIRMAKNVIDLMEIGEKLGYKTSTIGTIYYKILKEANVYTRQQVISLLDEKSDEEIAKEGNVNADAVARVRAEIEAKKEEKKEDNTITPQEEKIIEMGKMIMSAKKIGEKVGVSQPTVWAKLKKFNIYNKSQVIKLLKEKTDKEIALEGNVDVDAVARVRQGQMQHEQIIKMAKDLKEPKDIASTMNVSYSTVYDCITKLHIYRRRQVVKLLEQKSDKEIALEGNVDVDAVARVREEQNKKRKNRKTQLQPLEQATNTKGEKKQPQSKKTTNPTVENSQKELKSEEPKKVQEQRPTTPIVQRMVPRVTSSRLQKNSATLKVRSTPQAEDQTRKEQLLFLEASRLQSVEYLEGKFGIDKYEIMLKLRKAGIPTREQVEKMINADLSNEEIAEQTGAILDAIAKVRNDLETHKKILDSIPEETKKNIIRLIGVGDSYNPDFIANKLRIPKEKIQAVSEERKKERLANQEKNKPVDYKKDMAQLHSTVNGIQRLQLTDIKRAIVNAKIAKILIEYEELLSEQDYAYIAYAYWKIKEKEKALDIGTEHLNLQNRNIEELGAIITKMSEKENQEENSIQSDKTIVQIYKINEDDQR